MDPIPWFRICSRIGLPPTTWMVQNPIKRYEFEAVTRSVNLLADDKILDVGCGKGHWTIALSRNCCKAVGIDTSADQINTAKSFIRHSHLRERVSFHCESLEQIGFPAAYFDHVFSFCVLEHIIELKLILNEIARVLKPGKGFHFSVDSLANITNPVLLAKHKNQHKIVQYFSSKSLGNQLELAGLYVKDIHPILTSQFAIQEFTKRIHGSYKYGFVTNQRILNELKKQDQVNGRNHGIMLIAHGLKPQ